MFQVLAHKSIHLTIGLYVAVSMTGFVCSLLLPIETKGRMLVVSKKFPLISKYNSENSESYDE